MVKTIDNLANDALQLPEDQRFALAHRILRSTEPPSSPAVESLWEKEIVRRIALLDSGATGRHGASEVFGELDRRLGA